jgi:hypothetical protein
MELTAEDGGRRFLLVLPHGAGTRVLAAVGPGRERCVSRLRSFHQRLRISLAISSASSPPGGDHRVLSPTKSTWDQETGNTNNAVESTEQNPPLLENDGSRQNHYVAVN